MPSRYCLRPALALLFLLGAIHVFSQEKNRIIGRVLNGETNMPIPNASVFITNTSKGTITSNTGEFELRGIPAGNYDLVISSVGYATQVFSFSSEKLPLNVKVLLAPKAAELETVTVEPFEKNGWQEWGVFFTENFIGTTDAAKLCRIRNYKTIRFRFSKKKNVLTAVAEEPLIIENRALGYKIQYQLEEFRFNFNDRTLFYLGYTLFEDMAKGKKRVPKRYIENRKKAYEGSMVHFIRSLYSNDLLNNGFETRRMVRIPNTEKKRVKDIMSARAKARVGLISGPKNIVVREGGIVATPSAGNDSTEYYRRIMQQQDYTDVLGKAILTADSLVSSTADSSRYLFFTDYLQIKYTKGLESQAFLKTMMERRSAYHPISLVFLLENNAIEIASNGSYYPPQNLFSSGYWAWSEKISHLLPLDYKD
jgi:hypothetical protein